MKRFNLIIDSEWWIVEDNSIKSDKYRDDLDGDDIYRGLKEGELTEKEVVDLLNELNNENEQLKSKNRGLQSELQIFKEDATHSNLQINKLADENEQLKSTIKEVLELLSEEVDLFSDKATEHDINAYVELKELDNKDAYYMATATKKAIKILKGCLND